ncbi:protein asteroid-like [Diabrotica virgifera virgifera]|uniref:Protein asteroid-like n=1 Tax=Diabrotica virgifera virgifera TaxID=50390 RepID=A0A6P7GV68_DIAVI|nr:protein asteroid-like [Diabrotica virgifera virgifera]
MGVKGLTTFINQRSEKCMEFYELHDTKVVLDGDAVLCQLYYNHTHPRNGCFGGDYDKYGNTIYKFFHMLSQCKITPYIILDGGYESRKMDRILQRFKQRIVQAESLNPRTESRNDTTPIFIREAFEDIACKLGIKVVRCNFEGDKETANIAKALKCPVMSNDSDFYIFDVPYIPFSTVKLIVQSASYIDTDTKEQIKYRYIPCKIYRVDKFLECAGGMSKEILPLFAALVGNDFMDGINISKLNMQPKYNPVYNRIEAIIEWLQRETKNSAIKKVLNTYKQDERELMHKKIEDAIIGYTFKNSQYLNYFDDSISTDQLENDCEDDKFNDFEKLIHTFPKLFLEKFRKSLYPTRFMDILTQNKYYNFKPQVEVKEYEHAHAISSEIMSAIHKILTSSTDNLTCLIRDKSDVTEIILPMCHIDLPSFTEIQTTELRERQALVFLILNIDVDFSTQCLNHFPESWHLLILTLKYMRNKSVISWCILYSIIFGKIIIDYVDPKIGFFRSEDSFNKEFYSRIKGIMANKKLLQFNNSKNLKNALDNITFEDAVIFMNRIKVYFEFNKEMKRDLKMYDRKLMHTLSQFQSCFLHIKNLNQLLNMPYQDLIITECFNGTFVYNFSQSMFRRDNLDDYVKYLFHNAAPSVFNTFEIMIQLIKECDKI